MSLIGLEKLVPQGDKPIDLNAVILFCVMISIFLLNCFYPELCRPSDLYLSKI